MILLDRKLNRAVHFFETHEDLCIMILLDEKLKRDVHSFETQELLTFKLSI